MFPFCGHFCRVSHQQSSSNKFKDFKTEYCGIQIETFEFTTVVYWRMKKLTRKPKFELHEKYSQGTQKFVRFRWFFELCEFELKEFSCKSLLVNSKGTKECVQFRWLLELQEFELHEFNCRLVRLVVTCSNRRCCMSSKAFSIDKILLNSVFPIIAASKYTLKPINSCIETWFQIFSQITKKAQKWVYSYQSRILLLHLNICFIAYYCVILIGSDHLSVCWSGY